MKLINFSVKNFRSITLAHKIAISNTTILIGKNNEGKSNLLKALGVAIEVLQSHRLHGPAYLRRMRHKVLDRRGVPHYAWERDFPINLQPKNGKKQTIFRLKFQLSEDEIAEFKKEIGSDLNGSLSIEIKIDKDNVIAIECVKSGKNIKETLAKKSKEIAEFIAQRIYFNYIPAIRTDKEAIDVISRMVLQELQVLNEDKKYIKALETIQDLQQPILDKLSSSLEEPLKEFLPSIESVKIELAKDESSGYTRRVGFGRDFDVIVDDGTATNIKFKGEGVKSLVTLALLKNRRLKKGVSVIAIEEPESHLHPGAIHQLNKIIKGIAENNQVIITTHNPLFVDRENIRSNIIIDKGTATPAKTIQDMCDLLGIKASDNLVNAKHALLVEGDKDAIVLRALLPELSGKLKEAIDENLIIIEPIHGTGNLMYKLSLLKESLCETYTLLDNDPAGIQAYKKAKSKSLIGANNCTFVKCQGMSSSELEDCISVNLYKEKFSEEFGVDLNTHHFKNNSGKWSDRMKKTFGNQGKHPDAEMITEAKQLVANQVKENPTKALNEHKRDPIDLLVKALEKMIKE